MTIDSQHKYYEQLTYPIILQHGEYGWHKDDSELVSCATYARGRLMIPEVMPMTPDLQTYDDQFDFGDASKTVNWKTAFLFYETEVNHFLPAGDDDAYPERTRRGTVATRIPCSRAQKVPWCSQEYVLDSYCRVEEDRLRGHRDNQARILRPGRTARAGDENRTILPSSHHGSRRFMTNKTADALSVVTARGKPMFFITVTLNTYWHEVKAAIPKGSSPYDYAELSDRIFKAKLDALKTRLFTGAIWGPHCVDADGNWTCRIDAPGGSGYMIDVIEFQNRGMPHAHIVVRFANPPSGCKEEYEADEPAEWLDRYTCGRKPTYEVLIDFAMIYRKDTHDTSVPERDSRFDDDDFFNNHYRVHPQLARSLMLTKAQFYGVEPKPSDVLQHLRMLVLGRDTPNVPIYSHRGPLEHGPHPSNTAPDPKSRVANTPKCKVGKDGVTCKSGFPFEPNPTTHIGEDGYARLKRHEGDEYIVPYNPWFLMEFESHINVEFAASSHCITYLYKYLFKGSRGEPIRFQFGDANATETVHVDETREYWTGKVTSASEAWWRSMS